MGSHKDCANWDYDDHPNRSEVKSRCERLTRALSRKPRLFDVFGFDTRPGHAFIFRGMAPQSCDCILGNYRGTADCAALTNFRVKVPADPRVGIDPILVEWQLKQLETRLKNLCDEFERSRVNRKPSDKPETFLVRFVVILSEALEQFLLIHPFANGNGHMGRLLIWVLLTRYGYKPISWPLDSRPPYSDALSKFRDGEKKPLQLLILQSIST